MILAARDVFTRIRAVPNVGLAIDECSWTEWIAICECAEPTHLMSAKVCTLGNAVCEIFFGRPKNEFFHYREIAPPHCLIPVLALANLIWVFILVKV